jgi:hypothetical protein
MQYPIANAILGGAWVTPPADLTYKKPVNHDSIYISIICVLVVILGCVLYFFYQKVSVTVDPKPESPPAPPSPEEPLPDAAKP